MSSAITMTGFIAAFTGWVIIGRVPAILHTPLMSGSNFVHGIVVVGGLYELINATTTTERVIGFVAVLLGAGNAAGGYAVTERMLAMFQESHPGHQKAAHAGAAHGSHHPAPRHSQRVKKSGGAK
jgi:NAD(P) transhydrogenase subunit alpha